MLIIGLMSLQKIIAIISSWDERGVISCLLQFLAHMENNKVFEYNKEDTKMHYFLGKDE